MRYSMNSFDKWLNEDLLTEETIGTIDDEIPFEVRLDTTNHSQERKFRHQIEDPNKIIDEKDVISDVEKAIKPIAKRQLFDIDSLPMKYHIFNEKTELNTIIELKNEWRNGKGQLVAVVVTTMYKKDFRAFAGHKKITVQ